MKMNTALCIVVGVYLAIAKPVLAFAADVQNETMRALAADSGCLLCPAIESRKKVAEEVLPFARPWQDIARKYHGQKNAEDKLTRIVLGGTKASPDRRHWQNKVSDQAMLPH
jgi:cytochrome c551/c552